MNFAIIGVGGFIAQKHLKVIHQLGHRVVAACDLYDSVGILDQYFDDVEFYTELERFDMCVEKYNRSDNPIDYVVVCSPNYLHNAHCRMALRLGSNVICEKPLTLNPRGLDELLDLEIKYDRKVYPILQFRLHPEILKLARLPLDNFIPIVARYISSRGPWYQMSWKGDIDKSGGLVTNIGIHLFDMLIWLFGSTQKNIIIDNSSITSRGILVLERARIEWLLSIDKNQLLACDKSPCRELILPDKIITLDSSGCDLHLEMYNWILSGLGFNIEDTRAAIECVYNIRYGNIEKFEKQKGWI